jgi:hypothetical protein
MTDTTKAPERVSLIPSDKPRVKPLVWTQKGYAETPFGKYHVVMEDWSGQDDFWFVCFAGKPYGKCGEHGSEEAAKAAAQADYESRILEALEPVTVREAARPSEMFHQEQVTIWAQEILEALAMHDLLKIDTYDAKIEAHQAISRELVDIGHALDTLCMTDRAAPRALAEKDT